MSRMKRTEKTRSGAWPTDYFAPPFYVYLFTAEKALYILTVKDMFMYKIK